MAVILTLQIQWVLSAEGEVSVGFGYNGPPRKVQLKLQWCSNFHINLRHLLLIIGFAAPKGWGDFFWILFYNYWWYPFNALSNLQFQLVRTSQKHPY